MDLGRVDLAVLAKEFVEFFLVDLKVDTRNKDGCAELDFAVSTSSSSVSGLWLGLWINGCVKQILLPLFLQ